MNLEAVTQIFFSSAFTVAPAHPAAALFAALPQSARDTERMAPMLGSAAVLSQLQSICVDALHAEIDWTREIVLGASVRIAHTAIPIAGETVEVSGYVIGIGESSVTFQVDAKAGQRPVANGTLCFAIAVKPEREQSTLLHLRNYDASLSAVNPVASRLPSPRSVNVLGGCVIRGEERSLSHL